MSDVFEARVLPAGTIVHMNGVPLRLEVPATASTHPNNWPFALAVGGESGEGAVKAQPAEAA